MTLVSLAKSEAETEVTHVDLVQLTHTCTVTFFGNASRKAMFS